MALAAGLELKETHVKQGNKIPLDDAIADYIQRQKDENKAAKTITGREHKLKMFREAGGPLNALFVEWGSWVETARKLFPTLRTWRATNLAIPTQANLSGPPTFVRRE